MTDPEKPKAPSSEEEDYKRLMNAASWFPIGHGLWTFVLLVPVALSGLLGFWEPPYRVLGMAVGGTLVICGACLFYDIPLRRLGRVSKGALWTWIVLSWAASAYWLVARLLAD